MMKLRRTNLADLFGRTGWIGTLEVLQLSRFAQRVKDHGRGFLLLLVIELRR